MDNINQDFCEYEDCFYGNAGVCCPSPGANGGPRFCSELVICQPDKPRGRGRKLSAVSEAKALELGLEVYQPACLKDPEVITKLQSYEFDLGVVVAYGKIIPDEIVALPVHEMINIHPSLLPKYRGLRQLMRL